MPIVCGFSRGGNWEGGARGGYNKKQRGRVVLGDIEVQGCLVLAGK